MTEIEYPRLLHAIEDAIRGLELEARCYGYLEDPEHTELIAMLQDYKATITKKSRCHVRQ